MTLLGRFVRNTSPESTTVPLTSPSIIGGLVGPTGASGVRVTETSSLGMSAVWRAVTLISGTCAALPLHAYRQDGEVRKRVTAGQSADLLDNPHPDMTALEVWEQVYAHICLWGNAYLRILRDEAGIVRELWPIHPSRVRVGRDSDGGAKWYSLDRSLEQPYNDTTILHIPGFGYDGICGCSPIRAARQGIGLGLAAEQFGSALFGSGSLASGVLQTEQRLDQASADRLKGAWKSKVGGGLSNAHEIAVLDRGTKFQPLTINPDDAQFIESRRFQTIEVARFFGVAPFLMLETEKSTSWGTGLEQQVTGWVRFDLSRYYQRVEQRMTRLLRPKPTYAKYAIEGLLRGDSQARAEFYKAMWDLGVFSTNEIRAFEELAPVDGGDVRYRPLNMGVLGESDPAPEPTPQPDPTQPDPAAPARPERQGVPL